MVASVAQEKSTQKWAAMRLFQNSGIYPAYFLRLQTLTRGLNSFAKCRDAFLGDRYGACHFLAPVLNGSPEAFFTNGDDAELQEKWASEQGMPARTNLSEILLAQIEHHGTEVFYNLDPMRYGSDFVRRLPGCVKHSIAWRAAPSPGADFAAYSLVVCNFPSIIKSYQDRGWRSAYLSPAHDPVMDRYAANTERPIDVLFVGGYSRHHRRRAEVLEAVAAQRRELNIVFHLDRSRLTRIAESPLGRLLPLKKHRRPKEICAVTANPVFGRDLYAALSRAKIVLNGAVDMAGDDRGNMRCFEAMGCGALMVSDAGSYPDGMIDGQTMCTYDSSGQVVDLLRRLLAQPSELRHVAQRGHELLTVAYDKNLQWHAFQKLAGLL
jgi:hypothetical protein